jgi:hypothetical protein
MATALISPQEFTANLRDDIADCSSIFHEMVYVASYWNAATRLYVDPDSGHVLPQSLATIVRSLHTKTFESWLSLPLADQATHLSAYLETLNLIRRSTLVRLLASEKACEMLVPPSATPEECALFCADLRAVVRSRAGAAS